MIEYSYESCGYVSIIEITYPGVLHVNLLWLRKETGVPRINRRLANLRLKQSPNLYRTNSAPVELDGAADSVDTRPDHHDMILRL